MFSIFLTKIFAAIFDLNGSKGLGENGICTKGVVHSKKNSEGWGSEVCTVSKIRFGVYCVKYAILWWENLQHLKNFDRLSNTLALHLMLQNTSLKWNQQLRKRNLPFINTFTSKIALIIFISNSHYCLSCNYYDVTAVWRIWSWINQ